jgi:hypothetical protein
VVPYRTGATSPTKPSLQRAHVTKARIDGRLSTAAVGVIWGASVTLKSEPETPSLWSVWSQLASSSTEE